MTPERKALDPRDRWAMSLDGAHWVRSERRLAPGERAVRKWTCSCGRFTHTGFDSAVRAAFRVHLEAEARQ